MSDVAGYWARQFAKVSPRSGPPWDSGYSAVVPRPAPIVPRYESRTALERIDMLLAEHAERKFYGEVHNMRNRRELDAIIERHRERAEYGPDVDADAARVWGLPDMPDAFYAFWLGKEGCL
jgi:hypothetical protein